MGLSIQGLNAAGTYTQNENVYNVAAVSDNTSWTNYAASSFEGGEGTAESPYLIKTAEQLAKLAKDVNEGVSTYENTYFKMVADIDLDGPTGLQ